MVIADEYVYTTTLDDSGVNQGADRIRRTFDGLGKLRPFDGFDGSVNRFRDSLGRFTLDPLKQAFKTLGVDSQASLNKIAEDARQAFAVISNSGRAATTDVANAFKAMEQAEREAAAGGAKALADQQARFESLKSGIASMGAQLQLAGGIMLGAFGGAIAYSVKAASDLSEAVNKVQVVFGASAKSVQEFAQSAATNLGLSQRVALDFAGSLGNMFTAMKLSTDAAATFSEGILSLAADVASFNNIPVEDALNKLKSGLQGEAEPLRSVGVLISDATIKAKAMELGIKGASGEMSEQQKVLLRYITILDQTTVQQGDFARTATGMANSSRILAAQFDELVTKIGDKFSTAGNTAIGVGVQLLSVFNNLPGPILAAGAAVLAVEASLGVAALAIGSMIALMGGPFTLAFIGIAAWAGALAIGISQNWEAIVEATGGMNVDVQGALKSIARGMGWVVDIISAATRAIITYFDVIVNGARILGSAVINVFKVISQSLSGIMTAILSGNVTEIAKAFTTTFASAFTVATAGVGTELKELANRTMQNVFATVEFLGGKTANAFGTAFDAGIKQAQSFDFAALRAKIEAELKKLTGAGGKAKKAGHDVAKELSDGFKDGLAGFEDAFKVISAADPSKIASMFDPLKKAGREGLKELSDAFKAVTPVVNEFLKSQGIAANVTKEELEKLAASGNTALLGYTLSWATARAAVEEAGKEMAGRLPVSLKDINQFLKDQGYEIQVTAEAWLGMSSASKDATVALGNLVKGQQDLKSSSVSAGEAIENITAGILAHKAMVADALDLFQRHKITLGEYINRLHGVVDAEKIAVESADNLSTHVESMADKIDKALGNSHFLNFAREQLNIHSSVESAIRDIEQYGEMMGKTSAQIEQDILNQSDAWTKSGVITRDELAKIVEVHKKAAIQLPGVWGPVFDKLGSQAKSWAGAIFGVLDTIPGEFGSTVKKVTDTIQSWVSFFDKILGLVNKFSSSAPASFADAFSKIIGIFKGAQSSIGSSATDILNSSSLIIKNFSTSGGTGNLIPAIATGSQAATDALHELGHSGADSLGGLATSAKGAAGSFSSAAGSFVSSIGGIATAITGLAALYTSTFTSKSAVVRGVGGGASFGLLGALTSIFFGGPSKEEKELAKAQIAAQLQQAKDAIALSKEAVSQAMTKTASDVADLMAKIADGTHVPKRLIQQFTAEMTRLLSLLADGMKSVAAKATPELKAAAENFGPLVSLAGSAVDAFDKLNSFIAPADRFVGEFFASLTTVVGKFGELSESVPKSLQKHAAKFAEKMKGVVEVIGSAVFAFLGNRGNGADSVPGLIDFKGIPAEAFEAFKQGLQLAVQKMAEIADSIDANMVKQASRFSDKAKSVADILKSGVEGLVAIAGFAGVPEAAFSAFGEGIKGAINLFIKLADELSVDLLGRAVIIAQAVGPIADALKAWAEASVAVKGYSKIADDTWDSIKVDFDRTVALINLMLASAIDFLPKSERFRDVMKAIADNLKAGLDSLGGGLAAAASAFGGVVNAIEGGAPPGSVFPGGDATAASFASQSFAPSFAQGRGGGASSSQTVVVNLNVNGNVIHQQELRGVFLQALRDLYKNGTLKPGVIAGT